MLLCYIGSGVWELAAVSNSPDMVRCHQPQKLIISTNINFLKKKSFFLSFSFSLNCNIIIPVREKSTNTHINMIPGEAPGRGSAHTVSIVAAFVISRSSDIYGRWMLLAASISSYHENTHTITSSYVTFKAFDNTKFFFLFCFLSLEESYSVPT